MLPQQLQVCSHWCCGSRVHHRGTRFPARMAFSFPGLTSKKFLRVWFVIARILILYICIDSKWSNFSSIIVITNSIIIKNENKNKNKKIRITFLIIITIINVSRHCSFTKRSEWWAQQWRASPCGWPIDSSLSITFLLSSNPCCLSFSRYLFISAHQIHYGKVYWELYSLVSCGWVMAVSRIQDHTSVTFYKTGLNIFWRYDRTFEHWVTTYSVLYSAPCASFYRLP